MEHITHRFIHYLVYCAIEVLDRTYRKKVKSNLSLIYDYTLALSWNLLGDKTIVSFTSGINTGINNNLLSVFLLLTATQ